MLAICALGQMVYFIYWDGTVQFYHSIDKYWDDLESLSYDLTTCNTITCAGSLDQSQLIVVEQPPNTTSLRHRGILNLHVLNVGSYLYGYWKSETIPRTWSSDGQSILMPLDGAHMALFGPSENDVLIFDFNELNIVRKPTLFKKAKPDQILRAHVHVTELISLAYGAVYVPGYGVYLINSDIRS